MSRAESLEVTGVPIGDISYGYHREVIEGILV
jgi:hypothetical protein